MRSVPLTRFMGKLIRNRSRRFLLVCFCLVLVIVSVLGIFAYFSLNGSSHNKNATIEHNKVSRTPQAVCDASVVASASSIISAGDISRLNNIAQDILKKDNHSIDVNCDYILAIYYLQLNDSKNAEKYIDELELSIASGGKYSDKFSPSAKSPAVLRKWLSSAKINENLIKGMPIIVPNEVD